MVTSIQPSRGFVPRTPGSFKTREVNEVGNLQVVCGSRERAAMLPVLDTLRCQYQRQRAALTWKRARGGSESVMDCERHWVCEYHKEDQAQGGCHPELWLIPRTSDETPTGEQNPEGRAMVLTGIMAKCQEGRLRSRGRMAPAVE